MWKVPPPPFAASVFFTSEAEEITPLPRVFTPLPSLLVSSLRLYSDLDQLAVDNLLNSIDRQRLASWPATQLVKLINGGEWEPPGWRIDRWAPLPNHITLLHLLLNDLLQWLLSKTASR